MSNDDKKKFVALSELLHRNNVPWGALAEEIECNGIFRRQGQPVTIRKFGPHSEQAQEALNAVAFDLLVSRRSYDPDFDTWYQDENPTYYYGWPVESLPRFKFSEEYPWFDVLSRSEIRVKVFASELYTVGRVLLTFKGTTGQIATVIERYGLHGYDPVGRSVIFAPDGQEISYIISALAEYHAVFRDDPIRAVNLLDKPAFVNFGWPREELPDFSAIGHRPTATVAIANAITDQSVPSPAGADQQSNGTDEPELSLKILVGALVELLLSPSPNDERARFSSQEALINELNGLYAGTNIGLRERTLKKRIGPARQALDEALRPDGTQRQKNRR